MAKTISKLATVAIVAFAIGTGLPASADDATSASECISQGNVWVHVEFDEQTDGGCATKFGTAQEATTSAGLTEEAGPFYTTISGRTADAKNAKEWWSLWSKDRGSEWVMAQVGANELKLEGGQILSWSLQPDWDVEAVAPKVDPLGDKGGSKPAPTTPPAAGDRAGLPGTGV